jgi:hypothetical protein
MQALDSPEFSYLTHAKKEINGLNITKEYKNALIKYIEELFDPDQLTKDIHIDEYNRKMIVAERELVLTRFFANENDVLFANPYQIENNILRIYHAFISRKLK